MAAPATEPLPCAIAAEDMTQDWSGWTAVPTNDGLVQRLAAAAAKPFIEALLSEDAFRPPCEPSYSKQLVSVGAACRSPAAAKEVRGSSAARAGNS